MSTGPQTIRASISLSLSISSTVRANIEDNLSSVRGAETHVNTVQSLVNIDST